MTRKYQYDQIDWSAFADAYGKTDVVPRLLLDLDRGDARAGQQAAEQLFERLYHQEVVESAGVPALPFLVRSLLERPACWDVVSLLACLTDRNGGPHAEACHSLARPWMPRILPKLLQTASENPVAWCLLAVNYPTEARRLVGKVIALMDESPAPVPKGIVAAALMYLDGPKPRYRDALLAALSGNQCLAEEEPSVALATREGRVERPGELIRRLSGHLE